MSIRLQTLVWSLDLPWEQQHLLLAMADHADDEGGKCFPGVRYLVWKTNRSERSVQRGLRELEAARLIVAVAYPNGGRGRTTEYRIALDHAPRKVPYESSNGASVAPIADIERVPTVAERVPDSTERVPDSTERVPDRAEKGANVGTPTIINHQGTIINRGNGAHPPENEAGDLRDRREITARWLALTDERLKPAQQTEALKLLTKFADKGDIEPFWALMQDTAANGWKWVTVINRAKEALSGQPHVHLNGHHRKQPAPADDDEAERYTRRQIEQARARAQR